MASVHGFAVHAPRGVRIDGADVDDEARLALAGQHSVIGEHLVPHRARIGQRQDDRFAAFGHFAR